MDRRDDEAWRAIVDNFGERAQLDDDTTGTDPSPGSDPARRDPGAGPGTGPGSLPPASLFRDPLAGRPEPSPADDRGDGAEPEERFVPPTPPPLPRPAPPRLAAWAGVLGMPVLLVVLLVAQVALPPWWTTVMALWFLGGFAYLVAAMPGERPDDGDNGARV